MDEKTGEKKKVLIVEDEMSLRIPLSEELKSNGFEVHEGKNGLEGLEAALAVHPDIILLDVVMPKMSGTEMLQKLWEDPWGKTANVLILTNSVERGFVKNILGNNMPECLIKSDWDMRDIVKKVRQKVGIDPLPPAPVPGEQTHQ